MGDLAEGVDLETEREEGKKHHRIAVVGIEVVAFDLDLGLEVGSHLHQSSRVGMGVGRVVDHLVGRLRAFVVGDRYRLPLVGRLGVSSKRAITGMGPE